MTIIQDKTRIDNLKQLYEMRDFFSDDSNGLSEQLRARKLFTVSLFVGFICMLIGIVSTISAIDLDNIYTIAENSLMLCLVIAGAITVVYSYNQIYRICSSEIMSRYKDYDMFLFWLLESDPEDFITLNHNRSELTLHRNDGAIVLPVGILQINGMGRTVEMVDLDNKVLIMEEHKWS